MTESPKTELSGGGPVTEDHREIDPTTGMQKGYVVLTNEERSKGFVRPVRRSYQHVGKSAPSNPLRDLTKSEKAQYGKFNYGKFETYPESEHLSTGRYWTQAELDSIDKGCGVVTRMARDLAETYARKPDFYGGTFCFGCRKHLPVNEFVWEGTDERVGS